MKCPHCLITFHDVRTRHYLGQDPDGHWFIESRTCPSPECKRDIHVLVRTTAMFQSPDGKDYMEGDIRKAYWVWPRATARQPLPIGVPGDIAEDYKEAALVFADSPKASAALSRRCLQHFIREVLKIKKPNLALEIDAVIDAGILPSNISAELDKVRIVGNFAAHPDKSTSTGLILDVEVGEAEWNLEVLDDLFDFYYVRRVRSEKLKEELNKKLIAAGKTPLP
jgi:hypothetical protein